MSIKQDKCKKQEVMEESEPIQACSGSPQGTTCFRHGVSAGTPLSPLQSLSRRLYHTSLAMDAGSQPGLPMTLSGLSNLSANLVSLHWCLGHLTVIVNVAVSQNAALERPQVFPCLIFTAPWLPGEQL